MACIMLHESRSMIVPLGVSVDRRAGSNGNCFRPMAISALTRPLMSQPHLSSSVNQLLLLLDNGSTR